MNMEESRARPMHAMEAADQSVVAAATPAPAHIPITHQPCRSCGASPLQPSGHAQHDYVYALGRIEARFPLLSIEKEFAQAVARSEMTGRTDRETFYSVLSHPDNHYLARHLCWVMTIETLETYVLLPRDRTQLDQLVESQRPARSAMDVDCVVGTRGPLAPPETCNGLTLPVLAFDQIYSFDRASLMKAIPRPHSIPEKDFGAAAIEVFERIMRMTDNAGASDEHRALNYLAVRYDAVYAKTAEQFARDYSLTGIEVHPSALGRPRKIMEVVFSYRNRRTDYSEKFFVRVDVTEEFPFLVTKLAAFLENLGR
jgi:hypothetical protein